MFFLILMEKFKNEYRGKSILFRISLVFIFVLYKDVKFGVFFLFFLWCLLVDEVIFIFFLNLDIMWLRLVENLVWLLEIFILSFFIYFLKLK